MFKLIGAVLVVGCCGMLSGGYIIELRKRVSALRKFTDALPILRTEICDFLTPTDEAFERAGLKNAELGISEYRYGNSDVIAAELSNLQRVLGRCGTEEQRIAITRAETRLNELLAKLESERSAKGKVFAATAISAGLMVAIILI